MAKPKPNIDEKLPNRTHIPHWKMVWSQSTLTPEVITWPYEGSGTTTDPYIVTWLPSDSRDPMQFPQWKKWCLTCLVALVTMAVALISSAYSVTIPQIMEEFHVSSIVATLGISLYVLGFAIGPVVWGPLSELYGRQHILFISYAFLTAFNAGAAGARNISTLLILRFLAGAFGASPLTNAGAVVADLFPASHRGVAMTLFAAAPSTGPVLGPIVGGFLGQAAGWRWVQGLMAAFSGTVWLMATFFLPETYSVVLLRKRAKALEEASADGRVYRSRAEMREKRLTAGERISTALFRPWVLFFHEPIVMILSIYLAVVYGTLYLLFAAYPLVYNRDRHWSESIGGLAFLGVLVGSACSLIYSYFDNSRYMRVCASYPGGRAPPEARLPPVMVGAVACPVGLFWFAWTNAPTVHWLVSISAGGVFAFGMILAFLSINYLVDAYTVYAASVIASTTVLRSLAAAAFPLFTGKMYERLGIHWASSVPAFLALACAPFPFLFWKYGSRVRKRCKYASIVEQNMLQERRDMEVAMRLGRVEVVVGAEEGKEMEPDSEKEGGLEKEAGLGEEEEEVVEEEEREEVDDGVGTLPRR